MGRNNAAFDAFCEVSPETFVVDVWNKSFENEHGDNLHLVDDYYWELASLFAALIAK